MNSPAPAGPTGGLSLSALLNILWRRRLLVLGIAFLGAAAGLLYGMLVTPLYVARTTLQPGVTTFNAQGLPEREWQVKDIVQWYKRGDYNPGVAEALDEDPQRYRPVIRAAYLPRGPQSRGGNTITLTTLAPGPEEARRVLTASIDAFIAFAGSDSSFSNIHLMRVRIASNIAKQEAKIAQLQAERSRIELQIAAAEQERAEAEASRSVVQAHIDERLARRELLTGTLGAYEEMLAAGRIGVEELRARVDEWEQLARQLRERQEALASTPGTDPLALLIHSDSINGLLQEVGSLRLGMFDQSDRLLSWEEARRTLKDTLALVDGELEELRFELAQIVPRKVFEAEQKRADLELKRDFDLPQQEAELREDLRAMISRHASLSPVEPIGEPVASARPVRPRRPRAFLILFGLGLASGIFAALCLEYLSRNWREITRPSAVS